MRYSTIAGCLYCFADKGHAVLGRFQHVVVGHDLHSILGGGSLRHVSGTFKTLYNRFKEQVRQVPPRWFGARNVMTICRDLQRPHRKRFFIFTNGKLSPRWARNFTKDSRAECLHLRQYAP
jgi:hypothetical protein